MRPPYSAWSGHTSNEPSLGLHLTRQGAWSRSCGQAGSRKGRNGTEGAMRALRMGWVVAADRLAACIPAG